MTIKKNVASQRIGFIMVDATDFATPEAGLSPVGHISKDGGSFVSATNSISEADSAVYVLTLQNSETNCDLLVFKATSAGAADQHLVFYPGVIESIVSNVLSTLDDNVASELTAIKSDVTAVYSALSDLEKTIVSDVTAVYSALSDCEATLISDVTAVKSSLSDVAAVVVHATYGLDAIETITSLILQDTGTTLPASLSDILSTIDSAVVSTLDHIVSAIDSTVAGPIASILADTKTALPAEISGVRSGVLGAYSALSDLEATIVSDVTAVYSALSDFEAQHATDVVAIKSDVTAVYSALSDFEASIIADVSQLHESVISDMAGLGAGNDSAILSTIDHVISALDSAVAGPVASILIDTKSIIADVSQLHESVISDIATVSGDSGAISALHASIVTDVATVISDITAVYSALSDLENAIVSDVTAVYSAISDFEATNAASLSDIRSGVTGVKSALSDFEASITADVSQLHESVISDIAGLGAGSDSAILSTIDHIISALDSVVVGPVASILIDTKSIIADVSQLHESVISDMASLGAGSDSAILSTIDHVISILDSVVVGPVASILVDTAGISAINTDDLSAVIASILVDTKTTLPGSISVLHESVISDIAAVKSSVSDVLAATTHATYGLDALETITSDILEAIDSAVAGPIASILVDTNATLDNKIDSVLADTKEINSQADSILADTRDLSNATYGFDALETITSDILEALDSVVAGPIASILVDTNATLYNKIDSILEDTKSIIVDASDIQSAVDIAKKIIANKMVIEEATGSVDLFEDDDVTSTTVATAFTTDATDTTRKKLR